MKVMWSVLVSVAIHFIGWSDANKPVFDLSNNMRLVLLPADTKLGTVIYKLRASDADEDYPLQFRVSGDDSHLIEIKNIDCTKTICEADVILLKPLSRTRTKYNLSLEAIDTRGEITMVETEFELTPHQEAFIGAPRIVRIAETTKAGSLIESFIIMENPDVFRGISCQLLPVGAREYFSISPGLPTAIKGESRCDLRLEKELDYESRSSFVLEIIAENAWTDTKYDTRNVVVHEFIVEVQDVQDSAPYFLEAPPVTRLPETAEVGDRVLEVKAFDGDYAHPRRIRYGLDPKERPFSSYFQIDSDSGIITVRKNLQDIETRPNTPVILRVLAEEIPSQPGDFNESTAMSKAEVEVAVIIDDVINSKPRFLQNHYTTNLEENAIEGTVLVFSGDLDIVEDTDKGENGKVELFIEGDFEDTFEISPAIVENRAQFRISVKSNKKLDFETLQSLTFKITARELGINKLSTTATVTVNLIDVNDNAPRFVQDKYVFNVFENEAPGKVLLKVAATDPDSLENGAIRYTRLIGDDPVIEGLRLDPVSGEISLVKNEYLDRETIASHTIGVEAMDRNGEPGGRSAQATIVINVVDVNDQPPIFLKKKYQGFMNGDLTKLRNDLQVEATDKDQKNTKNSQIRYEIIKGNYDKKFVIDEVTGVIMVGEPLTNDIRSQRRFSRQNGINDDEYQALSAVEPIITLMVRAYDLGIPSLDAEVPVYIYTEDMFSRTMRFIISQEPQQVEEHQAEISDLISTMTGGDAEIQDINPYYGNEIAFDGYEIAELDVDRESKAVASKPKKSVVDVFIRYPANSIVDMNAVTSKLVANSSGAIAPSNSGSNSESSSTSSSSANQELEQRNATLFWALMLICLFLAALVFLALCCYCCPGCYYYKGDKVNSVGIHGSERDIRVLTVTDGAGRELKDAKFVEIIRSAKDRIRSAASMGRTSELKRWRVRSAGSFRSGSDRSHLHRPGQRPYQLLDPKDSESIILVREAGGRISRRSQNGPKGRDDRYRVRDMEELDAQALADRDHQDEELDLDSSYVLEQEGIDEGTGQRTRRRIYHSRKTPIDKGKIFKVVDEDERNHSRQGGDDIQVLRLDDDTRREETYRRVGGSEILSLDEPKEQVHKAVGTDPNHPIQIEVQGEPRRTRSELDLAQVDLPDDPGGEFYTAVGPDGKEIILRRYLNDQASENNPYMERGFLSMAMVHLQDQHDPNLAQNSSKKSPRKLTAYVDASGRYYRLPDPRGHPGGSHSLPRRPGYVDGYDTGESIQSDNDSNASPYRRPHYNTFHGHPSQHYNPNTVVINGSNRQKHKSLDNPNPMQDLTPKHQIRTPILEETESTLEAERLKSRQSRRDQFKVSYDHSDASVLRFRINDGNASPEPAYTDTKASILRRRNTMAKMLKEEDNRQSQEDPHHLKPSHRYRHWSLNELNQRHDSETRAAKMRKWNSLSNDELINYKHSLSNTRVPHLRAGHDGQIELVPVDSTHHPLHPHHVHHPASQDSLPRKFSKHISVTQRDRDQGYNDDAISYPREANSQTLNVHNREPLWYRLTNGHSSTRGSKGSHSHAASIHRDPLDYSQASSTTSSEVSLPSRASSVMSQPHRHKIDRMVEQGQNSRSIVDENFAKNIGITPDSSGRPGRHAHLTAPHSQYVPESGSEMNSLEYTFDHNGEVVSKDDSDVIMIHEHPRVRRHTTEIRRSIMNATPRYMDWYNGPNQNSPHRPSQLSTISAPAIPYGSLQSLRPTRTRSPSRELRTSMVRTGSLTRLPDEQKLEKHVIEHLGHGSPHEEQSRPNSMEDLQEDSSESGISSLSQPQHPRRKSAQEIMSKKSVFSRAYDDVSVRHIRPNSAEVLID